MKTKDFKELLASINEARKIHAGKLKARRITPERVATHIKERLKNPCFKESYKLEARKLNIVKRSALNKEEREREADFSIGKLKRMRKKEFKRIDDVIKAYLSEMEKKAQRRK